MNSSVLKSAISQLHQGPEWRVYTEYRIGARIADAIAINQSLAFMVGYEVKVSRQDFTSDARKPEKRAPIFKASNEFYYVCPSRVIAKSQVPEGCGLIEYRDGEMVIAIPAPRRIQCDRNHLDAALKRLLRVKVEQASDSVALKLADFATREASRGQRDQVRLLAEGLAREIAVRYWQAIQDKAEFDSNSEGYALPRGYAVEPDWLNTSAPLQLLSPARGVNGRYDLCVSAQPPGDFIEPPPMRVIQRFVHDLATGWMDEVEGVVGFSSAEAESAIKALLEVRAAL